MTVLSYGVGNIPISVSLIMKMAGDDDIFMKHAWFWFLASIVRVVGCHAANPFIYGILDKKLLTFWKFCGPTKQKNTNKN
jgi:hypothetical protein